MAAALSAPASSGAFPGCEEASLLPCGGSVSGDTDASGTDLTVTVPCSPVDHDGPELLYVLGNPRRQTVSLTLESSAPELDILVARDCDPATCFAVADEVLHLPDLPAGDYFVLVDGRDGVGGAFTLRATCAPTLRPERIDVTVPPGGDVVERKEVHLTPAVPRLDVLFVVDLTVSMLEELREVKQHARDVILRLAAAHEDLRVGLVTFEDYYAQYGALENCGYEAEFGGWYGFPGDEPYRLNVPLTGDLGAVDAAWPTVFVGDGRDEAESYGRALHESTVDPRVGWRPAARRLVVLFGDGVPHDCELDRCPGSGSVADANRGRDPGRDEVAGTADDLPILDVVDRMAAPEHDIVLLAFESSEDPGFGSLWQCWSERTGGSAHGLRADGTPPGGGSLADLVVDAVEEELARCGTLTLRPAPGFEDWLVSLDPPELSDVTLPVTTGFDLVLAPPPGTAPGLHELEVVLECDGVAVGRQDVSVLVSGCTVAAALEPVGGCEGTEVVLDASRTFVDGCDGEVRYAFWRDGVLVRDFEPSWTATDTLPAGRVTYRVDVTCSGGSTCSGRSSATVDAWAAADPLPPPVGPSLRVTRAGDPDVRLTWMDHAPPDDGVTAYEAIALDATDAGSPEPPAMEAASLLGSVAPGVQELTHFGAAARPCSIGDRTVPCRLVFYKVRATSRCSGRPGPACNGFPAQAPCP